MESTIDNPEILDLLKGQKNELRSYAITLGQSSSSKGVMFVLYSIPRKISKYALPVYLGQLADDLENAIKAARSKVGIFEIELFDDETFRNRAKPNVFPFGKHKGKTVQEIFDVDYNYIFWAANNCQFKSTKLTAELSEYAVIAKELIITENHSKSNDALPIEDKVNEKQLTIYSVKLVDDSYQTRLRDASNNKYHYKGKIIGEKDQTIMLKCRVSRNFTALGNIFNVLNLR